MDTQRPRAAVPDSGIGAVLVSACSLAEYRAMFALPDADLRRRLLDCPGGAASFTAEVNAAGGDAWACDPVYAHTSAEQLATRAQADTDRGSRYVRAHPELYRWSFFTDVGEHQSSRAAAITRCTADRRAHPERYVPGELPRLPFADYAFDVVVSSHLLFSYADRGITTELANVNDEFADRWQPDARLHALAQVETIRIMSEIAFGINVGAVSSQREFSQLVRRADALGYDVLAAPDHLGALAPFAALTAAGMLSDRLRLRTCVLNAGFWNPALLAREVATLDVLSRGRAELGLGAGHMKSEYQDAGLPWLPLGQRVTTLEATVLQVRRRLADEAHRPSPMQRSVPLMVGGMSRAALAVAARHAEIVGFTGLRQMKGAPAGTFTLCSAAEMVQRVDEVRRRAGGRLYRSDVLLQWVVVGQDPERAAAQIAASAPGRLTVEQLMTSPVALLARDVAHAVKELRRRQQVYGFDSVTTHTPNLEPLAAIIAAHRAA